MKVRCVSNIQKTPRRRKLAFTVGEIYDVIVDLEFIEVVQLYVVDNDGDEMTIASMDLLEWNCEDCRCWYNNKWFRGHFEIVE